MATPARDAATIPTIGPAPGPSSPEDVVAETAGAETEEAVTKATEVRVVPLVVIKREVELVVGVLEV